MHFVLGRAQWSGASSLRIHNAAACHHLSWDAQLKDEAKLLTHSIEPLYEFLCTEDLGSYTTQPTSRTTGPQGGTVADTPFDPCLTDQLTGLGYVSLFKGYKTAVSTHDLKAGNDAWDHLRLLDLRNYNPTRRICSETKSNHKIKRAIQHHTTTHVHPITKRASQAGVLKIQYQSRCLPHQKAHP